MERITIFILLMMLSACSSQFPIVTTVPRIKDGGFLTGEPCGPPCFYNIVPGSTELSEAKNKISIYENVFTNCKSYNQNGGDIIDGINCKDVSISFSNSTVDGLSFQPDSEISLEKVVNLYGPPDFVSSRIVSLPDKPFNSRASLYFDKLNTILILSEQTGTGIVITPDTAIMEITYLSEEEYSNIKSLANSTSVPWHGFGSYKAELP